VPNPDAASLTFWVEKMVKAPHGFFSMLVKEDVNCNSYRRDEQILAFRIAIPDYYFPQEKARCHLVPIDPSQILLWHCDQLCVLFLQARQWSARG
jgi:hypothetical protein